MSGFLSFVWLTPQFIYMVSVVAGNFAVWLTIFLFWRASLISRNKEIDRFNYVLWFIASVGSATVVALVANNIGVIINR